MALPATLPNAWFLGTPEERAGGGRLGLLWHDTILPYSLPASPPEWWNQPAPQRGQFEGWQRNLVFDSEVGAANFPAERAFNCVVPFMLGLKESPTAPQRIKSYLNGIQWNESDGPGSEAQWPFRTEDQKAINFLEFYMDNFVNPDTTAMIVALPIRDVMNFIGDERDTATFNPAPDNVEGGLALAAFIRAALTKAKARGITILGWYLIDEPDFLLLNWWATAASIARLRSTVRQQEALWRLESPGGVPNDPEYLAIPLGPTGDQERQARLLPCVTTFSRDFGEAFPYPAPPNRTMRESPTEYAAVRAADLYLFDWYPYRRTLAQVTQDWSDCTLTNIDFRRAPHFTFADTFDRPLSNERHRPMTPKVSLRRFQDLRRLLNLTGDPNQPVRPLTDPDHVPVMLWSQAAGAPFRDPFLTTGTALEEPAPIFPPGHAEAEQCLSTDPESPVEPIFPRQKKMPIANQVRFYAWAGVFNLSEGMACFSQTAMPDQLIQDLFVPVASELNYFQSLRWSNINLTEAYVPLGTEFRNIVQGTLPAEDTQSPFPPVFIWLRFKDAPGPLQGIAGELLTDWLIVINRDNSELSVEFNVNRTSARGHFPAGDWVLHEWRFLEPLSFSDSIVPIRSMRTDWNVRFTVPAFRMRLFQTRRRVATDPF